MIKNQPRIDLTDPTLFGNDAAEDEDEGIFSSYVLERDEISEFMNPQYRIRIVRAYKGEGKSALLRLSRAKLAKVDDSNSLLISSVASSIAPEVAGEDSHQWTRGWMQSIFRLLASEIGSQIGMAWTDDGIALVEEAERNGFKERNIVSAVYERLKVKVLPEKSRTELIAHDRVVKRWLNGKPLVWLFVDDVDQNFQNTPIELTRVSSFLTACRLVVNLVPQIRLRVAIRPNVWATVKRHHEALSHCEQYVHDLHWSSDNMRRLLAHRIEAYLIRTDQSRFTTSESLRPDAYPREESLIQYVFTEPWWATLQRPPHVVLTSLCRGRPRWLVELCKVAAKHAKLRGNPKITLKDVEVELKAFGKRRIDDTIAEFKPQCAEVGEIIDAFAQQANRYKTADLSRTITRRVLQAVHPKIVGVSGTVEPLDVAAFLFEVGFLSAQREREDGTFEDVSFRDNPSLLKSKTNVDQGVTWEIHRVFREALDLKETTSTPKTKKTKRNPI